MKDKKRVNRITSFLNKQSKKDRIILATTIIALLIVIGGRFLLLPQIEVYLNNLNTIHSLRLKQSKISTLPLENQKLREEGESLGLKYDEIIKQLPKTSTVAQITHDIEKFVINSSVTLKSLSFSQSEVVNDELMILSKKEENEENLLFKQIVNISVDGDYKSIMLFIKEIENYNRIAEVATVNFSKDNDKKLNGTLTANFYNLNYQQKEQYDFNNGAYGREDSFN